jgi:hypothetical protein
MSGGRMRFIHIWDKEKVAWLQASEVLEVISDNDDLTLVVRWIDPTKTNVVFHYHEDPDLRFEVMTSLKEQLQ